MNKILSKGHMGGKIQTFKRILGSFYILYFYVQSTQVKNLKSYRLNFYKISGSNYKSLNNSLVSFSKQGFFSPQKS